MLLAYKTRRPWEISAAEPSSSSSLPQKKNFSFLSLSLEMEFPPEASYPLLLFPSKLKERAWASSPSPLRLLLCIPWLCLASGRKSTCVPLREVSLFPRCSLSFSVSTARIPIGVCVWMWRERGGSKPRCFMLWPHAIITAAARRSTRKQRNVLTYTHTLPISIASRGLCAEAAAASPIVMVKFSNKEGTMV